MADFGNAGKITTNVPNVGGVSVNLGSGEHLCYKLTVLGGPPRFNLVRGGSKIWTQDDFGTQMNYNIDGWPRDPSEVITNDARNEFSMSFFNDGTYSLKYSLRVEHHDKSHTVKEVLMDHDYESDDPTDAYAEGIRVVTT